MYLKIVVGLIVGMGLIGCGEEYIATVENEEEALSILTENLRNADDGCGYCIHEPEQDGWVTIRCYYEDGTLEGCAVLNPAGRLESAYCD